MYKKFLTLILLQILCFSCTDDDKIMAWKLICWKHMFIVPQHLFKTKKIIRQIPEPKFLFIMDM